ncbi:MAG: MBL fold metallo-hydrolase [bacterium]
MKKWYVVIFLILFAMSAYSALVQQDFSQVKIKSTHVAGNVYMLEGRGGNIGVSVGEDGILMVDDQFAPLADRIKAALKKLNPGQLQFILNTHWHGDHTGGNEIFGREGTIIAHTNVRKRLSTTQHNFGRTIEPKPEEAWPVITFDQSLSVHFNGEEIKVVHYPHGHTDGDAVIYFVGSNVVHMGDDFFSGQFPFIDLNSGGSVQGLIENVGTIMEALPADVKIIPGHGPLSTIDDLKSFQEMLKETTSIVRNKMDAGKKLEEIQKEGLPEKWSSWGTGFINTGRWIEIIYNSLSRKMTNK